MACVGRNRGHLLALRVVLDVVHAGDPGHKALNGVIGEIPDTGHQVKDGQRNRSENTTQRTTVLRCGLTHRPIGVSLSSPAGRGSQMTSGIFRSVLR